MAIDLFGNDSAVNQQNSLNAENVQIQSETQDWNNKVQTQYNQDKAGESLTDDATYSKDLAGNVMGSLGLNQAYKGRKDRIVQDAKKRLAEITPSKEVPDPVPSEESFSGLKLGFMKPSPLDPRRVLPTAPAPTAQATPPPPDTTATTGSTPVNNVEGEPRTAYLNGGTAEEESSLKATIGKAPTAVGEETDTLLGMGLGKVTGGYLGEGAAKTIGRVGGAAVSGTVAGIDVVEGIDNLKKGQNFFGKDHDWEDVVSKTSQMIAGASDVAGLIPAVGPEIAAIGNVIGLVGGVVGMFGDHSKNLQNDQNVEDELNAKKAMPSARVGDQIAGVSQSTLQAQTA